MPATEPNGHNGRHEDLTTTGEGLLPNDVVVGPDGARYRSAQEGRARIYVPLHEDKAQKNGGGDGDGESNTGSKPVASDDRPQQVFYNPIQQFNRDLSVLAIKAYGTSLVEKRTAAYAKRRAQWASKASKKRKWHENKAAAAAAENDADTTNAMDTAGTEVSAEEEETESARPSKTEKRDQDADAAAAATIAAAVDKETGTKEANGAEAAAKAPPEATASKPSTPAAPGLPDIRILDALSATGLRALRYAHELPFGVAVTANDLLPAATASIRRNVTLNGLTDKITVVQGDALAHMYTVVAKDLTALAGTETDRPRHHHQHGKHAYKSEKYDVIDLDPYGTAAPFFDAALQAVRNDGGLLCVTCTDAAVWASQGYPEKCFALYGGVPMKGSHSHEAGLRIVLHALSTAAARYGLAVTPLLSLSIDFYCRVFVTVARAPARVKFHAGRTMVAYNCDQGCGAWATQPLLRTRPTPNKRGTGTFYKYTFAAAPTATPHCDHCGTKMHLAGPMYAGPLHSAAFVQRILADLPSASTDVYGTTDRIRGMLQTALEELVETAPVAEAAASADADAVDEEAAGQPDGKRKKNKMRAERNHENGGNEQQEQQSTEQQAGDDADNDAVERQATALDPCPFFFVPTNLAKAVHCSTPNEDAMRGALLRLGYQVTRSHCKPGSIKTDAPWSVVWDVMRAWVAQKAPVKRENIRPGTAAYRLLRLDEAPPAAEAKEGGEAEHPKDGATTTAAPGTGVTQLPIVFDEKLGRQHARSGGKLVRYQINPRENWGPMNRAKGH
ncbi:N2,N2-dimethylguanosine tRNA methyltransferase [Niveomyces insectorum RCEF 264]|uniref:tRNA (guanine(26)-N(2))-dimethyltransferase n=1 Tax=Niveomyces insectorum RCEF 264 TaxID=1081102 RepID=A0A167MWM6_9HYPO|nr:N2,N2-dimethylguanosine tRNA methyltransferase [Niveomyces insectorum RCEF 264]